MLPVFEDYEGNEPNVFQVDGINALLDLPDNQFNAYVDSKRRGEGCCLSLKKTSITFTEVNLQELSIFDISFQSLLFELRARINILNDEISKIERLNNMTFDSSITAINHERIIEDINKKYLLIQNMTDRVISKINEIIDCKRY